jgi:hypothetical protein
LVQDRPLREVVMMVLKLGFIVAALVVLHEFLAAHGSAMGAHVITGAAAFIVAILFTLIKESFI